MYARLITPVGATALLMSALVMPPASASSIRYAAPAGSGSACTQTAPCTIEEAIGGASAGDTVQLTADEYYPTSALWVNVDNLTISGPATVNNPGDFVPYIIFKEQSEGGINDSDPKLIVQGNNFRMQRVAVVGRADGTSTLVGAGSGTGATYDRVLLRNSGGFFTLRALGGTVTNSLVVQTGASPFGGAAMVTGTVTGSTFYSASGTALAVNGNFTAAPHCSATIRNSMAWGATANLEVDGGGGGCGSLAVEYDHSWIPDASGGSLGGGITVNSNPAPTAGPGNLPNTPVVFDPTDPTNSYLSDLVLPPGSPAIDAGCTTGCGNHDYYGRPRPIGAANDIGPREQSLAPGIAGMATDNVTAESVTVSATINPRGEATSYDLQVRELGASSWSAYTGGRLETDLFTAQPVAAAATGLNPETTYEVRLNAVNARGVTTGPITTVTTPRFPTVAVSGLTAKVTKRSVVLRSRVAVSAAGVIAQKVRVKRVTRCTTSATATTPGRVRMRCAMGKSVRKALRSKAVRFKVVTTLTTTGGTAATTRVPIRVPRQR